MRRLSSCALAAVLVVVVGPARADRPKEQQGDEPAPPPPVVVPTAPPPVVVSPPPPPAVAQPAPPVVPPAAPAPAGAQPPIAPVMTGPTVVTPLAVPIVVRNSAPEAASIAHRLVTVDGTILGTCVGNCTFQVPPGTYLVESAQTAELRPGRGRIVVNGPTLVDVQPGSSSDHTTGLVLGITGGVSMAVGFFGTFFTLVARAASDCDRYDTACEERAPSYLPWVFALSAGAVASGVGWWMFVTSNTKIRSSPYAPAAPGVAIAPLLAPGVQGAALTVRF